MDIETIFTILFILVIIVYQVIAGASKKVRKKDAEPDAGKKPSGFIGRLNAAIERMREEMEATRRAATAPSSGGDDVVEKTNAGGGYWDDLMPADSPAEDMAEKIAPLSSPPVARTTTSGAMDDDAPAVYRQTAARSPAPAPRATPEPERPKRAERSGRLDRPGSPDRPDRYARRERPAPAAAFQASPPHPFFLDRLPERERIRELRRAVVWAEILAPPLALRRERDRTAE